METQVFSMK